MNSFFSILIKERLKDSNSFLDKIDEMIDWKKLKLLMYNIHLRDSVNKGRKPYPKITMLKAILLQNWYNLSDVELENCLRDRLSFIKFSNLNLEDTVPDHSTISRFRKKLIESNLFDSIFYEVLIQIEQHGLSLKSGSVIDATLIDAHSHPHRKEYIEVEPTGDEEASTEQTEVTLIREESKDPDARWLKRGKRCMYGYKATVSVDPVTGLIQRLSTTPANQNDTRNLAPILESLDLPEGSSILADKGFVSKDNRDLIRSYNWKSCIMFKRYKNDILRELKIRFNKRVSKVRYIVEQTFGCLHRHLGLSRTPYVGLEKTNYFVTMKCLVLHIKRASVLLQ